ncbi:GntR family transcriptional regulator [Cohnella terricola]|uniref:GntR family transcriptional regulator n=1 Tax=Cohnella terricola TaxID=1289167 RepID=A0A559J645_9BACL|nr:GntR family transcriptional regulator [Cohnella terricola]TVX95347.1 GntR family transcriptional regulator [Cohnella terricola]
MQISSARDVVYQTLKDKIIGIELPPGTSISENEISLQFNTSRTPVRESFVRLSQEGLLDIYPQRGTVVSLIDLELVEEARFIREQLECAIIRLACDSFPPEQLKALRRNLLLQQACIEDQDYKKMFELDENFHLLIFEGCRKLNTWAVIQQINVHLNRTRMLRLVADYNWHNLFKQHQLMADAIEKKDAVLAERLMNEHLHLTITDQALLKQKYPHYFK